VKIDVMDLSEFEAAKAINHKLQEMNLINDVPVSVLRTKAAK
jgi:hypothetical protein